MQDLSHVIRSLFLIGLVSMAAPIAGCTVDADDDDDADVQFQTDDDDDDVELDGDVEVDD